MPRVYSYSCKASERHLESRHCRRNKACLVGWSSQKLITFWQQVLWPFLPSSLKNSHASIRAAQDNSKCVSLSSADMLNILYRSVHMLKYFSMSKCKQHVTEEEILTFFCLYTSIRLLPCFFSFCQKWLTVVIQKHSSFARCFLNAFFWRP